MHSFGLDCFEPRSAGQALLDRHFCLLRQLRDGPALATGRTLPGPMRIGSPTPRRLCPEGFADLADQLLVSKARSACLNRHEKQNA